MRLPDGRTMLALALALACALPAAATEHDDVMLEAWQGQGQGRGNSGNADRGNARGNQGRDDEDRGRAQENQGRGNSEQARGQGNQGRGNSDQRAQGNQGRGNSDRARGQGNPGRGNGNEGVRRSSGNAGRSVSRANRSRPEWTDVRGQIDRLPANVRRMAASDRRGDRVVAGALTFAALRGTSPDRFRIESGGDRWIVKNDREQVLIDLDEDRARELGHWEMRRLGDRAARNDGPAFCRSGAGHPVWGREWCLEKGFGLGVSDRTIWSRTTDGGVVFRRRPTTEIVERGGLLDVLGDIVFGRLAVQSLALGYDEPLTGRWVASNEPDSPYVLRIQAGDFAVAELVDNDRDDDVDVLFVSQPRW